MNQTNYLQSYIFDKQTGWRIDLPSYIAPGTRVLCLYRVSTGKQLYHNEQNQADIVAMVFFSAVFAARAPAMGTARTELGSSHGSWKGSLLLSTPAHGSLSCVKTNSVSFASTQARKRKIRSLLRRGRRARRARFPTCGVIRVADIKLSRYKGENISLLSLPKKQPCEYQIWRKKLHKFFERSYRTNRMNPKYRNQK